MLEVENISYAYSGVTAISDVSLSVKQGEVVALIGANGAGKTTTLRCISGLLPARKGRILLKGKDITATPSHRVARAGIGHVLEGRHLFPHLTVKENLEMGVRVKPSGTKAKEQYEWVYSLFPRVQERLKQTAGTLSGGEQQMVAMARALLADPEILLLDEPSMGLAPTVVDRIFEIIRDVAASGLPILLVEQNANRALEMADRAYVLEVGQLALSGTGGELRNNDDVRKSYLGH